MNIILFLATYGASFVLVDSWLLKNLREYVIHCKFLKEFFSCYFCTGFWSALIISVLSIDSNAATKDWVSLSCTHFINGLAGATFSFALNTVLVALESLNAHRS